MDSRSTLPNVPTSPGVRSVESSRRGLQYYLPNVLILTGALLLSTQFQLRILQTEVLRPEVTVQSLSALLTLAPAAILSRWILRHAENRLGPVKVQFAALLLGLGISSVVFISPISSLPHSQTSFYMLAGIVLGVLTILLRARPRRGYANVDLLTSAKHVWLKRDLLVLWTRNNVRARYSQAVLGVIWVVLLPLLQAIIMAFVFSQIIRVTDDNVPFVSFYLAALIPWTFINNGIVQGSLCIINQIGLINQVYFPREILPLVKLGELAVDAFFTFLALVILNLLVGIAPNLNWVFLPLLSLIILAGTLGASFFLSVLSVYVRDVPQLGFVAMQLLFYLTPIIYPITFIPEGLRFIIMLNPLVPLIQGFREVIVFDRPVDLVSLYYPLVFAVVLLYTGYSFFKAHERRLTDYV